MHNLKKNCDLDFCKKGPSYRITCSWNTFKNTCIFFSFFPVGPPLLLPIYFHVENIFFVFKRRDYVVSIHIMYKFFFIKNTFSTHRFLAVMQLADKGRIWINLELFLFFTGFADDCNILLQVFLAVWPVLWRLGSFWTLHVYEVHSSSFSLKNYMNCSPLKIFPCGCFKVC